MAESFSARAPETMMATAIPPADRPSSSQDDARIDLPADYQPSADEEFMNPRQLEYFRRRLLDWKKQILNEAETTLAVLQNEPLREPDLNDRASSETDWSIELRTRDRQRKLITKIEAALRRIDDGEYGYCEVTGEPISLGRLEARPIATMTVEAQERHERQEKISRDD
jgi:DnaK suppressor protein